MNFFYLLIDNYDRLQQTPRKSSDIIKIKSDRFLKFDTQQSMELNGGTVIPETSIVVSCSVFPQNTPFRAMPVLPATLSELYR
jgi:hypothetical protein